MARIVAGLTRHRWLTSAGALAFAGLVAFVLLYFAPQDLFIDTSVNEALPSATVAPVAPATTTGGPTRTESPHQAAPTHPSVLARGRFRSGEHHTSGSVLVLKLSDGRVFVRFEGLDTSNGPALRVWLTAAGDQASDTTVHDARHVDLGGLKANHGNQNYRVPAGVTLSAYRSVVVWCQRFEVVFGAASLNG